MCSAGGNEISPTQSPVELQLLQMHGKEGREGEGKAQPCGVDLRVQF